jgi:hypothetical protein
MYTIHDYEKAVADLKRWSDAWDNYSGNNPEKFQSDIKAARVKVRLVGRYLKDAGVLPLSEREVLEHELDKAFPNARGNEVVEYNERRYKRQFFPLEKSRSRKTVTEWRKSWEVLED